MSKVNDDFRNFIECNLSGYDSSLPNMEKHSIMDFAQWLLCKPYKVMPLWVLGEAINAYDFLYLTAYSFLTGAFSILQAEEIGVGVSRMEMESMQMVFDALKWVQIAIERSEDFNVAAMQMRHGGSWGCIIGTDYVCKVQHAGFLQIYKNSKRFSLWKHCHL